MIKLIGTLLVLVYSITSFSQNAILIKNTNPKAKELQQSLNLTKDSLLLASENKILKVEIFNEDYESLVEVEDYETRIGLNELPAGEFIVEARLEDKIIVFDIIKPAFTQDYSSTELLNQKNEVAEGKGMMLDEELKVIKTPPNYSLESILTGKKRHEKTRKPQKFYWVVMQINNESGSCKTMKLVDQATVDRMILKHKHELNSKSGKLNKLMVWEVYDTSKFMAQQMSDKNYFYSLTSDTFNTTPYYKTHNEIANL
ncbi:hypothetical protein DFQ11_104101 [Winogradskyella epiphytica]|uniref:Uncharacterized protein n=1 Tax=Winogradskyella epiphytica TaxID=262005 RepID=A0A2V4XE48_9FLAO|nr:hypothetical protein [Winogradskyella epiphytica]PYE80734.1 hypothetical protein DFQ11_104101 [Winogradskyella epiphytica]GGW68052.1 hypothetical protein GCM10008085_19960 [Winogradskyella epiphytica]